MNLTRLLMLISLCLMVTVNAKAGILHDAVLSRSITKLELLLEKDININSADYLNGASPLHLAARNNYQEIARLLINQGANVDIRDLEELTPLHNAAWNGYLDMVKLLLAAGADINATSYAGRTPLSVARRRNRTEVIEFLQDKLQPVVNLSVFNSAN